MLGPNNFSKKENGYIWLNLHLKNRNKLDLNLSERFSQNKFGLKIIFCNWFYPVLLYNYCYNCTSQRYGWWGRANTPQRWSSKLHGETVACSHSSAPPPPNQPKSALVSVCNISLAFMTSTWIFLIMLPPIEIIRTSEEYQMLLFLKNVLNQTPRNFGFPSKITEWTSLWRHNAPNNEPNYHHLNDWSAIIAVEIDVWGYLLYATST